MQAAIGLVQFGRLDEWVATRRANAAALNSRFAGLPALRLTLPEAEIGHAYYKYYAFLRPERLKAGWDRDRVVMQANEAGIACFSGSCPEIYREEAFGMAGLSPAAPLPVAQALGQTSLMLPVDPTLLPSEIDRMGDVLASIIENATN
jgi:dTDP-4-amino-4,6-dideoxygalactose transaminase